MQVVRIYIRLVGIVTRLRAEGSGFPSPTSEIILLKHLGNSGAYLASYSIVIAHFYPEIKCPGAGGNNLNLVQSLRLFVAVLLFTCYSVMIFTVKLLYLFCKRGFTTVGL
jgi:hypothetical protein